LACDGSGSRDRTGHGGPARARPVPGHPAASSTRASPRSCVRRRWSGRPHRRTQLMPPRTFRGRTGAPCGLPIGGFLRRALLTGRATSTTSGSPRVYVAGVGDPIGPGGNPANDSYPATMAPELLTRPNARAYLRIKITLHWFVEQSLRTNAFWGVLPRESNTTVN